MADRLESAPETEWYTLHCKHLTERRTANVLQELLGLQTYLPELKRRTHGRTVFVPFFPGYLFVAADLQEIPPSRINAAPGVLRLLTIEDRPLSLTDDIIAQIHRRITELNTNGGLPIHTFHPGDTVRLKDGPLRGLEALFVGPTIPSERVRVLIEFLGQQREAEVNAFTLEHVSSAPAPKRERRTRGRGRFIRRQMT